MDQLSDESEKLYNKKQAQRHAEILYHLDLTVKELSGAVSNMGDDLQQVTIDIAIMKNTGCVIGPKHEFEPSNKRQRMKDSAAGGTVGSVIMAVIMLAVQFLRDKL